jgi:hypothetical protein
MAALISLLVHKDGDSHRVAVFQINGVNSGDTVDVGAYFKKVTAAVAVQLTSAQADFTLATSIIGTVITITNPGLNSDGVYLLCCGGAA